MPIPQLDYERIHEYVERNLQSQRNQARRGFFFAHAMITIPLSIFVLVNALIVVMNPGMAPSEGMSSGTAVMLIILGVALLVGLAMHLGAFIANSRRGAERMRERLTVKAVQLELARLSMSDEEYEDEGVQKRKRRPLESQDTTVRLSDDGELVTDTDQDTDEVYERGQLRAKTNRS